MSLVTIPARRGKAARVRAGQHVRIVNTHMAVDLLQLAKYGGPDACFGAYVLDEKSGEVKTIVARATVIAVTRSAIPVASTTCCCSCG